MHVDATTQVVTPAQMEHDQAALDAAEVARLAADAEHEAAARHLDVLEGAARRNPGSVDKGELRAAALAMEGTGQRRDTALRRVEERRVVLIISEAAQRQALLAEAVEATRAAASAALDAHAGALVELAAEQIRMRTDLVEATREGGDLSARIRLTGQTDRYEALPAAVTDPGEQLSRLATAARRRAGLL
jgi:hypothetical protein